MAVARSTAAVRSSDRDLQLKLRVEVLQADDLTAADPNGLADPYCQLKLGTRVHKTGKVFKTLKPKWMQSVVFFSHELQPFATLREDADGGSVKVVLLGYLVVEVWDHDMGNPDDFLGCVLIPLSSLTLTPQQQWYTLERQGQRDLVSGKIELKINLEEVEQGGPVLDNATLDHDLYLIMRAHGYQLPVLCQKDNKIVDFPGQSEHVEIAFLKVYVTVSMFRSEALVFLTNYRLIILSVSESKNKGSSDVSMWIALNNIASIEQGTGAIVTRKQDGPAERVDSTTITINCHDCRSVQLVCALKDSDESQAVTTKGFFKTLEREVQQRRAHRREKMKKHFEAFMRLIPHRETQNGRNGQNGCDPGKHEAGDSAPYKSSPFSIRRRSNALSIDEEDEFELIPSSVMDTTPLLSNMSRDRRSVSESDLSVLVTSMDLSGEDRGITGEMFFHRWRNSTQRARMRPDFTNRRSRQTTLKHEPTRLIPELTSLRPEPTSLRPELTSLSPELTSLRPELTSLRPELTNLRPELTSPRPELITLRSELTCLRPELTSLSPELINCGLSPDLTIEEALDAGTEVEREEEKKQLEELEDAYQRMILPIPSRHLVESLVAKLQNIVYNATRKPPALEFLSKGPVTAVDVQWEVQSAVLADMDRMMSDSWRDYGINIEYTICPSYPQIVYVPCEADLNLLEEAAKFRSKGRLPSLVWMNKEQGNFMLRSAQPQPGIYGKHSVQDEQLISQAVATMPASTNANNGELLTIFDARSVAAVQGNMILGKGTEDISRYSGCRLKYLDIPNIHAVRESYESLRNLVLSHTHTKWLSSLEGTQWLKYISLILKGASSIAHWLRYQGGCALVHCSDGWDRTAQLTSLTQLMIDRTYRTIKGFMILVDKEWLSYGHKFHDRLGDPLHPNDRSPVFLQFLDCVYQIVTQFPSAFEFLPSMLLCIAEQLNTSWFGNFLCNNEMERSENHVYSTTVSLWDHIRAIQDQLRNGCYLPTADPILPSWNIRRLHLWEEYFLTWDCTSNTHSSTDGPGDTDAGNAVQDRRRSTETVVWMSDQLSIDCFLCHQKFNLVKRKHHCRSCGRIFCNDCSKRKVILEHLGYLEPVRVCDVCYQKRGLNSGGVSELCEELGEENGFQVLHFSTSSQSHLT